MMYKMELSSVMVLVVFYFNYCYIMFYFWIYIYKLLNYFKIITDNKVGSANVYFAFMPSIIIPTPFIRYRHHDVVFFLDIKKLFFYIYDIECVSIKRYTWNNKLFDYFILS